MPANKEDKDNRQPGLDELIPLSKAAKISGLSHDHLRRLAGNGEIWARKIGRNWVTTESAIKDYLALNRKPGRKKS